jgi:molecular chaperone GrpE
MTGSEMSSNPEQDPAGDAPGQPSAADAATDVERLAAELNEARAQAADARDAQLRAFAEMENVRRRAQRDVEAAHKFAVERFAADLIEVRDTLELGLAAAGTAPEAARFAEGTEATLRLLDKAFERAGIAVVDPSTQPFNPELHEAMVTQPTAEQPPGTVLAVIQKGFTLNGRLLRPARVVIARAPDLAN